MARQQIFSGSSFEEIAGYARAVVDGEWIFVSGTTGYDYQTGRIASDPAEQASQCFANIEMALGEAGSSLEDVVRVVIFLADRAYFDQVAEIVGARFRNIRPANTTVVCELVKSEMKVEIEVTARRRTG